MGRDNNITGTGTASGFNGSGTLTIDLGGKTYKGNWVIVEGGSLSLMNGMVGGTSFYGNGMGVSGSSPGNALLKSEDGDTLRCQFMWSDFTYAATGICEDKNHKLYDMQGH